MSWKFVFRHFVFTFKTREQAAVAAFHSGYKFLCWNADVLFVADDSGATFETGIVVDDLV